MRYIIVVWLCGLMRSAWASCSNCQNQVELNYNNVGSGWSVLFDENQALKGSGGESVRSNSLLSYFISFSVPVDLLRVELEVFNVSSVGVVLGYAFGVVANYNQNVPLEDFGKWGLGQHPYIFSRSEITIIIITFTLSGQPTYGLRGLAMTVCVPECVRGPSIETNPSLEILPGLNFSLAITGPSLPVFPSIPKVSDNPMAVLDGSKKKVILRKNNITENRIEMSFPEGINVKSIQLKTKRGTGVSVRMSSNGIPLFEKEVAIDNLDVWITTEMSAPMGAVNDVKDIVISLGYNLPSDNRVKVKKLRIETCA